jgi:hypothetical protein
VDTLVPANRRKPVFEAPQELPPEVRAELSSALGVVETSHHLGEPKKPVTLKGADDERSRTPGSPTERNMSMFSGGTTQTVEETRKDTLVASDGLSNAGNIGAATASVQNLYSTGGASGKLPDQEADTIRDDAQRSNPGELIESSRGKVIDGPNLREQLGRILDNTVSDAFTTANAVDITVDMEQAADVVDGAQDARKRLNEQMNAIGISPSAGNEVIRNLSAMASTRLGESEITAEEIVAQAAETAKKTSNLDKQVTPQDVVREAANAAAGKPADDYGYIMLKDLMLNKKVQKDPGLMTWIEGIIFDQEEQRLQKAA